MIPRRARQIRFVMLGLMVAVVAWVIVTFHHPPPGTPDVVRDGAPPGPAPRPGGAQERRASGYEVRRIKDGRVIHLHAKEMVGREEEELRLKGVTLNFSYHLRDKDDEAEIVSDECLYDPRLDRAKFSGHVHMTSKDGFALDSETLDYDGAVEVAKTDGPFSFRRHEISGTGHGFEYKSRENSLTIAAQTYVRVEGAEGHQPTEVRSEQAFLDNVQHVARFVGAVETRQEQNVLKSRELLVNFNDQRGVVERMQALREVTGQMYGVQSTLGKVDETGGKGTRELHGDKLDMWFRPGRSLEKMVEYGGDLVIHPGPKDPPEERRLAADVLIYNFDENGRLAGVEGMKEPHKEGGQDLAHLTVEPQPGSDRLPRSVTCKHLTAQFDADSGDLQQATFMNQVVFVSGSRRALAGQATFDRARVPGGLLALRQDPEIEDPDQGSRLKAATIDLEVETGEIDARQRVQHVIGPKKGAGTSATGKAGKAGGKAPAKTAPAGSGGALAGSGQETIVTSERFHYDAKQHQARYWEGAVMRSGTDELHALDLRISETPKGRQVLATGEVLSIVTARNAADPHPMEIRAQSMVYDETAHRADYEGDVVMHQGDTISRSPKSTVYLSADGRELERVEAGDPVEIQQGVKVANGNWGIYRPEARTLTVTGSAVTLKDPDGQTVRGRSLTFNMAEDSIHVDGREEARTETTFRKDKPLP